MTARCPREYEMTQAIASGVVPIELRRHAGACQVCLTTWLTTTVHASAAPPPRLDPSSLWERAGRMRRLRAEAQMARIVTGAQVAAAVLILAVLVFFGGQSFFGPQPATWTAESFAGLNATHLVAAVALIFLAGFGLSRLLIQDNT